MMIEPLLRIHAEFLTILIGLDSFEVTNAVQTSIN